MSHPSNPVFISRSLGVGVISSCCAGGSTSRIILVRGVEPQRLNVGLYIYICIVLIWHDLNLVKLLGYRNNFQDMHKCCFGVEDDGNVVVELYMYIYISYSINSGWMQTWSTFAPDPFYHGLSISLRNEMHTIYWRNMEPTRTGWGQLGSCCWLAAIPNNIH